MAATDFALGWTLKTGEANPGSPSYEDAEVVSCANNIVDALFLAEQSTATNPSVQPVFHTSPMVSVLLRSKNLIDDNGLSPSGVPFIISSAYYGISGIWVTGKVFAAVGDIEVNEAIDRRTNSREAWAVRSAIVGFNTCFNRIIEVEYVPDFCSQ